MNVGMMLKIIKQPWGDVNDIKALGCCGLNQAYKIKNKILQDLEDRGKPMFDKRYVPMDLILKELNFNKKYFLEVNNE